MIFRATPQWFISLDKNGFRQNALEAIKKVRWIPSWGEERISNMVRERPDWCISRQRAWGVPIVAFYCSDCDQVLLQQEDHRSRRRHLCQRGRGCLVRPSLRTSFCPRVRSATSAAARIFARSLTSWTSGSTPAAAIWRLWENARICPWPSDLYIEGGDQYRGWFQSSLLIAVALRGEAPYRAAITHGWTLDEKGRAMSKSKGIGIDPNDLVKAAARKSRVCW